MRRRFALPAFLFVLISTVSVRCAVGQRQVSSAPIVQAEPTGAVTGHVFCADNNEPARFAKVQLEAIPEESKTAQEARPVASADIVHALASSISTITETALDGSFTLSKVKPGSYYVVVEKGGYIKPRDMFTAKEIADPSADVKALVESVLPRVRVEANQTEHAEVRLERGAAISGTVRYDDGSPAAELTVHILHKDEKGKWVDVIDRNRPSFTPDSTTDDRGYFRIASLLPNDYLVEVRMTLLDTRINHIGEGEQERMMVMSNSRFSLPFFGRGFARQKDALPVTVGGGQEITGQDVTIPVSKLRHLTGRVAAGPDSHVVNAASVVLVTRDDGKKLASSEISREDGLFHFDFVPEGEYTLRVTDVRDVTWDPVRPDAKNDPFEQLKPQEKERTLASYGDTERPLQLEGDMTGIVVTVPRDAKPPKPTPAASE